jgi:hypothetical protein
MAGLKVWEWLKSRQGRKKSMQTATTFCRPWRDLEIWVALFPAINGWAIFATNKKPETNFFASGF